MTGFALLFASFIMDSVQGPCYTFWDVCYTFWGTG